MDTTLLDSEIAREQAQVDLCYARLAELRARAESSLEQSVSMKTSTPQSVFDREAFASNSRRRLQAVSISEQQLVFGRMDREDEPQPLYVGRIGLSGPEQERVLIDWRAPVGSFFYRATASAPQGVIRRRTLITRERRVLDINDDLLVPAKARDLAVVAGEGALLHSLLRERGEFMIDIVATIQAEQDEVIRAHPKANVLLTGGPGTGKSVVALHRTAFLMYERAAELERTGVLVVGPGRRFSRYISRVLPSLGETAVTIRSVFDLTDPVVAHTREPLGIGRTKGSAAMAEVMRRFLIHSYPPPPGDLKFTVEGQLIRLPAAALRAARNEALRNLTAGFNRSGDRLLRTIARTMLKKAGRRKVRQADVTDLARLLSDDAAVVETVEHLLPQREPVEVWQQMKEWSADLAGLMSGYFPRDEVMRVIDNLVQNPHPQVGDLPLIDELDWLLGPPPAPPVAEPDEDDYREVTTLQDRLDGARRQAPASARTSGFGHVVVDEAQDLSPMQWRMLGRRGEDATWTIVGDPAQATLATPEEMHTAVDRLIAHKTLSRFSLAINYRTPREIIDYASRQSGVDLAPLRSIRSGAPPVFFRLGHHPRAAVAGALQWLRERGGSGCFVILDPADSETLQGLTAEYEVLPALEAKGLEFDNVVLFRPEACLPDSAAGASLVLIGATRATKGLAVITAEVTSQ